MIGLMDDDDMADLRKEFPRLRRSEYRLPCGCVMQSATREAPEELVAECDEHSDRNNNQEEGQ